MRPATRTRWDSDPSWADIARTVPRVARLLERAHSGPTVRNLVRALFLDRLDAAHADGRNVGDVARELGIGRRTAWRWILEMERNASVPERPQRTA
jgi:hypothetical protein